MSAAFMMGLGLTHESEQDSEPSGPVRLLFSEGLGGWSWGLGLERGGVELLGVKTSTGSGHEAFSVCRSQN